MSYRMGMPNRKKIQKGDTIYTYDTTAGREVRCTVIGNSEKDGERIVLLEIDREDYRDQPAWLPLTIWKYRDEL